MQDVPFPKNGIKQLIGDIDHSTDDINLRDSDCHFMFREDPKVFHYHCQSGYNTPDRRQLKT